MGADMIDFTKFRENTNEPVNSNAVPADGWLYLRKWVSCEANISKNPDGHHWIYKIQLCFSCDSKNQSYRRSFILRGDEVSCETSNWKVVLTCDGKEVVLENVVPWLDEISDWIAHPISSKQLVSQTSAKVHQLTPPNFAQSA